jgi:hypothetical protein
MKIDITELQVISLEPGDVLVIKIKPCAMPHACADQDSLREELSKILSEVFPNNKVILAEPGDEFVVIKQKAPNGE